MARHYRQVPRVAAHPCRSHGTDISFASSQDGAASHPVSWSSSVPSIVRLFGVGAHSRHDDWLCGSSLEIRTHSTAFPIVDGCSVYPQYDTIPELKRNGFDGNFHSTLPSALFESLLTNAKTETLVKAGYHKLARKFIYDRYRDIDLYWTSVKVCIRNHYAINDASVWCDYIDALRYFGKDLHNAKYVCPTDLKAEHDRWIEKKERKEIEKSINDKIEQFQKDEEKFRKLKSRYFGIHFTDGLICVHVLESVEEYLQEGEHMHHCVYSNKYYLKKNSLILSATINLLPFCVLFRNGVPT